MSPAADPPTVLAVAAQGDPVAQGIVEWAGRELGGLANGVIRQLSLEAVCFDVVLAGSFFDGSPLLADLMRETIHAVAPGARLVRLTAPPVTGAVVLAMEQLGLDTAAARPNLLAAVNSLRPG